MRPASQLLATFLTSSPLPSAQLCWPTHCSSNRPCLRVHGLLPPSDLSFLGRPSQPLGKNAKSPSTDTSGHLPLLYISCPCFMVSRELLAPFNMQHLYIFIFFVLSTHFSASSMRARTVPSARNRVWLNECTVALPAPGLPQD